MQAASSTPEEAGKFLDRVVSQFNACVRSSNFADYVEMFADDAVIDYEGVPERGPIAGKQEIAEHFENDAPDDEIRVTRWKFDGANICAQFVWKDIPEATGGSVYIEPRADKIARLTLAFGGPAARWR